MISYGHGYGFLWLLVLIWTLPWKGYALWISAQRREKWWFVLLLVLNTLAILEIFYIFKIAKKNTNDIKHAIKKVLK